MAYIGGGTLSVSSGAVVSEIDSDTALMLSNYDPAKGERTHTADGTCALVCARIEGGQNGCPFRIVHPSHFI